MKIRMKCAVKRDGVLYVGGREYDVAPEEAKEMSEFCEVLADEKPEEIIEEAEVEAVKRESAEPPAPVEKKAKPAPRKTAKKPAKKSAKKTTKK